MTLTSSWWDRPLYTVYTHLTLEYNSITGGIRSTYSANSSRPHPQIHRISTSRVRQILSRHPWDAYEGDKLTVGRRTVNEHRVDMRAVRRYPNKDASQ